MAQKRKRIALVLNWYDARLHQGVLEYASQHDWDLYDFHQRPADALSFNGDGLICLPGKAQVYEDLAKRYQHKMVVVGSKAQNKKTPSVVPDDFAIGRCAAAYLLERGFRHLAVVSLWSSWFVDARTEGFFAEAKAAGIHVQRCCYNPSGPAALADDWDRDLDAWFTKDIATIPRPLGVYAPLDSWAQMLLRACRESNILVPEELAFVGTNNDPLICPYTDVPLSSVDMNWPAVGYAAAEQLAQILGGGRGAFIQIPPVGVVTRRSSDVSAVPDIRVARAVRYIQDHLFERISASSIATAVQVPLRTLQLAFRSHLQRGIREEVTRRRIDEIKRLLRESDMTASQIADVLNYTTVFSMLRLFKNNTGMTTREFRAQIRRHDL